MRRIPRRVRSPVTYREQAYAKKFLEVAGSMERALDVLYQIRAGKVDTAPMSTQKKSQRIRDDQQAEKQAQQAVEVWAKTKPAGFFDDLSPQEIAELFYLETETKKNQACQPHKKLPVLDTTELLEAIAKKIKGLPPSK